MVVGLKLPGAVDGAFTLNATQEYMRLWGELVGEAKSAEDLFKKVRARVPHRTGEFVLWWSCPQQFPPNATVRA